MRSLRHFVILMFFTFACSASFAAPACRSILLESKSFLELSIDQWRNKKNHQYEPKDLSQVPTYKVSEPSRNALLKEIIYGKDLVEASDFTRLMSDKLFQVDFLKAVSPKTFNYFPKTLSFRQFLKEEKLVDASGEIIKSLDFEKQLEQSLRRQFPQGFVVKPAAGYNTDGRGFYINDLAGLTKDLVADKSKFIGRDMNFLFKSEELGISSGEGFIVQELLIPVGGGKPPEYRVHTFENRVVEKATESRWLNPQERNFTAIESYVQNFLSLIPKEVLAKQAWGLDVVELSPGNFRIIEINTNRGQKIQWSGYLISSIQLGSLVRHLEKYGYFKLEGPGAQVFRTNKAGLESWIRKEGREAVIQDLLINDPELAHELTQTKP